MASRRSLQGKGKAADAINTRTHTWVLVAITHCANPGYHFYCYTHVVGSIFSKVRIKLENEKMLITLIC
jgi:hypothetical protein